ncbi:hypothetical protein F4777DRAFT_586998 [Nemania sp. FL0916]|nr:hypothetical protein F4777DRAFT_586998 [Nemania sp. FL0916]
MMFLGTTRKAAEIQPEQKWDAISLQDFKSSSVFTWLAYGYLYFSILLSLAVYGVDIFTAINLLAFNQWSSSIKPTQLLTFDQTKWIFAGTIIASFVNLIFEHFRAWRVMKRGSVAECYLDTLAVRLESVRVGSGQGWRRFLVFAELTKSKKGAEYVALFSYFSLQSWIRVLLCSGPRQVVNALTLYAVYTLNLTPTDDSSFGSTIGGFFSNLKALAAENTQQAVILSGMLFTLVIWIFSFLFLLLGVVFYVFFLWHYIPRDDGGLHGYCERKVNKRLTSIVKKKINKALAKSELKLVQGQGSSGGPTVEPQRLERQATLPTFMDVEKGDTLPGMPMLNRNDTMATLPLYTSRPASPGAIELGSLDQKRPPPLRKATTATVSSTSSYSSRVPLIAGAADMGFDRSGSPAPTLPNVDFDNYQGPSRPGTAGPSGNYSRRPPMNDFRSPGIPPSMPDRNRPLPSSPSSLGGFPPSNRPTYDDGRSITGYSTYSSNGPRPRPAPSGYQSPAPHSPSYPPPRSATAASTMATLTELHSQWHPGEQAMQRMLGVPGRNNPTVHELRQAHGYRVTVSPLVAFGALDDRERPWVTVWGGEAGFCRPVAQNVLGVNSAADARFDPVVQALFAVRDTEESSETQNEEGSGTAHIVNRKVVRPEGRKIMAGLSIDLETRDRLKLAGRFIAGAATTTAPGVVNLEMAFGVEEALGNCPKYLNKKHIVPHIPTPELVGPSSSDGLPLPQEAVDLIAKADLFFIASKHGDGSMDVNHRGGAPGFLRVFRNQPKSSNNTADSNEEGVVLVYPEYSGNRLYQTLGNLSEDPVAGLVVPDFETGDVLYLTGKTTILVAERAAAYMPHAKLALRIDVVEARFVRTGLAFRGKFIDHSPYNPPVRRLAAEKTDGAPDDGDAATNAVAIATLSTRQVITPTVARYVFKLAPVAAKAGGGAPQALKAWYPGQHVTLDFSSELDHGYSHMRDEDPQSLNDDFVRTFTVSAPPTNNTEGELEIVVRRHGPATALLANWNLRVPLEIPVLAFGGAEEFHSETGNPRLKILWSLRAEDVPLAVDVFDRIPRLGSVTKLFVTGSVPNSSNSNNGGELLAAARDRGAEVETRRMAREDVLGVGERGKRKFFCCTGPLMMKALLQWMEGEEVAFESFEY